LSQAAGIGRDHQRPGQRRRNELGEASGQEGRRVGRDRRREGRLDEGAADQRRVEDIEADAAEQRLAQGDGDDAGHRAHPQRKARRQRQRQQQPGDDGRVVRQAPGLGAGAHEKALGEQAGAGHHGDRGQRRNAVLEDVEGADRQQRIHHVAHDGLDRLGRLHMRRGADFD
jgi:hypothetical protein